MLGARVPACLSLSVRLSEADIAVIDRAGSLWPLPDGFRAERGRAGGGGRADGKRLPAAERGRLCRVHGRRLGPAWLEMFVPIHDLVIFFTENDGGRRRVTEGGHA